MFVFVSPFIFPVRWINFSYQHQTFLQAGLAACGDEIELQVLGLRS